MVVTQKITRPTAILSKHDSKCENGFLLRIIRCQILDLKHLKLRKLQS